MLVRHGATDWSQSGRHTGWTDVPLNDEGLRQARALAQPLSRWSFDAVLCSTLIRARLTCELAGLAADARFDPDLREWNYGDYEGLTTAEIHQRQAGWNLWDDGVPNGESLAELAVRSDRVIEEMRTLGGDVAVVAHGHLLRVLAARWLGQPALLAQHLNLATASISQVGWEHHRSSINLWNGVDHLGAAG